jgi:flavin reductase (DIM6/NTAB) family NADH-FMN oxidoreductase RutF
MSETIAGPSASAEPVSDLTMFRAAMRELAGGVAVVTVGRDADITGFTATSVTSLSGNPARLLVCVNLAAASWKVLQRFPHFGINLLGDRDREIANRFAGGDGREGSKRYEGWHWSPMVTGTLLLDTALAALDCDVEEMIEKYDHAIVVGRVRATRIRTDTYPLVYWRGGYHPFERPRGGQTEAG